MTPKVQVLGERILAHDRFKLTLTTVEVTEADGGVRRINHEIYHYKGAVALLLYDPERQIVLLVRQFRLGAYLESGARTTTEVCAGMRDDDPPETAVVREAMEETGIAVTDARHVFDAFPSPGATTEKIACFVAQYSASDRTGPGGGTDEDERIDIIEPGFDEALAMIDKGEICDAKTIALLYYAKACGLMDRSAR
jgi:nudix-type nucleoside diphosphatase (YffH/AdpP family)